MASSPIHEGRELRDARERRNLSLEDAAEATRISKHYLEALEREAPVEEFPAPVYGRAFLREYASYLGLEPGPLVEAFDARNAEGEAAFHHVDRLAPKRRRRWPRVVAALLGASAVVGLIALILTAIRLTSPGEGPASRGATGAKPSSHASRPAGGQSSERGKKGEGGNGGGHATRPSHIRVVLRVEERCWVRAEGDGRLLFPPATLEPGDTKTLRAKSAITVTLGNAGGVRLVVNGRSVRTGVSGEVVDLSLRLRDGRVVVSRE